MPSNRQRSARLRRWCRRRTSLPLAFLSQVWGRATIKRLVARPDHGSNTAFLSPGLLLLANLRRGHGPGGCRGEFDKRGAASGGARVLGKPVARPAGVEGGGGEVGWGPGLGEAEGAGRVDASPARPSTARQPPPPDSRQAGPHATETPYVESGRVSPGPGQRPATSSLSPCGKMPAILVDAHHALSAAACRSDKPPANRAIRVPTGRSANRAGTPAGRPSWGTARRAAVPC